MIPTGIGIGAQMIFLAVTAAVDMGQEAGCIMADGLKYRNTIMPAFQSLVKRLR